MRIARLVDAVSWKYAIGEVVLIVVGVTLALMASSWYESRQDRSDELLALGQIASSLESDLVFLRDRFETHKDQERELVALLEMLQSDHGLDSAAEPYLQAVTTWRGVRLRSGPYDELKNRGLSLISNDALRLTLVDLYESGFSALRGVATNDEVFSRDQVLPFFYNNLRRVDYQEWTPLDGYSALDADPYFENLVAAKLDRLQAILLPAYEEFFRVADEALSQVRSELRGGGE